MPRDTFQPRIGISKLELLIAVVVMLLLVGVVYDGFKAQQAADYERRANDAFKLTMIGLFNFSEGNSCLPEPIFVDDDGKPKASWRFLVLTYVDANKIYIPDRTKPWIKPDKTEIDLKAFAQRRNLFSFSDESDVGPTRIAAVTGPDTAFDDANRCLSFRQLDGDTIVLVEVVNSQVLWTEPGDFTWAGDPTRDDRSGAMTIGAARGRGFHVAFKDGTVWLLSRETPLAELSRFFTARGAHANDREKSLGRYRL